MALCVLEYAIQAEADQLQGQPRLLQPSSSSITFSYYKHCSVYNSVSYAAALQSNQPRFSFHVQATDKAMQQRVAVALAWLGKEADLRLCFVDRKGLDVLLELLTDQRRDTASHKEAAGEITTVFGVFVVLQYVW